MTEKKRVGIFCGILAELAKEAEDEESLNLAIEIRKRSRHPKYGSRQAKRDLARLQKELDDYAPLGQRFVFRSKSDYGFD